MTAKKKPTPTWRGEPLEPEASPEEQAAWQKAAEPSTPPLAEQLAAVPQGVYRCTVSSGVEGTTFHFRDESRLYIVVLPEAV